jgi:hypothetical protein
MKAESSKGLSLAVVAVVTILSMIGGNGKREGRIVGGGEEQCEGVEVERQRRGAKNAKVEVVDGCEWKK